MQAGRVLLQGHPREVMHTEALRSIYGLDMPVADIDGHRLGLYWRAGVNPPA